MKKIAIIEEIDKEGLKLLDGNPKFTYEIITDTSEENLIKVLPNFDGCSLRISKLTNKILSVCKNLKIPEKFSENNLEEERFKKLLERKEDPDIKRGLGSIAYKLIKD